MASMEEGFPEEGSLKKGESSKVDSVGCFDRKEISDMVSSVVSKTSKSREMCSQNENLPIPHYYNRICPACPLSSSCYRFRSALQYYGHTKDRTVDIVWH